MYSFCENQSCYAWTIKEKKLRSFGTTIHHPTVAHLFWILRCARRHVQPLKSAKMFCPSGFILAVLVPISRQAFPSAKLSKGAANTSETFSRLVEPFLWEHIQRLTHCSSCSCGSAASRRSDCSGSISPPQDKTSHNLCEFIIAFRRVDCGNATSCSFDEGKRYEGSCFTVTQYHYDWVHRVSRDTNDPTNEEEVTWCMCRARFICLLQVSTWETQVSTWETLPKQTFFKLVQFLNITCVKPEVHHNGILCRSTRRSLTHSCGIPTPLRVISSVLRRVWTDLCTLYTHLSICQTTLEHTQNNHGKREEITQCKGVLLGENLRRAQSRIRLFRSPPPLLVAGVHTCMPGADFTRELKSSLT